MEEAEELLVTRRPKRSTAGNRMEAALAELAMEEVKEEEDVDFVMGKDEDDVFESDFASTDDEAAQEDVEQGDTSIQHEERRERKAARAKVDKATAAAHARQRVTFNPEAYASTSGDALRSKIKPKRRVSLGVAVNVETGEVIERSKRKSKRRHTILNTSATVNRIRDAEKKASVPKKVKITIRGPTQDELIARALDTEEGNIIEHRDYLKIEEEKRARARVVRPNIEGPMLRWTSRVEEIKIVESPPVTQPSDGQSSTGRPNVYVPHFIIPATSSSGMTSPNYAVTTATNTSSSQPLTSDTLPVQLPNIPPNPLVSQPPPAPPPEPVVRTEKVCKNYVIHAKSQLEMASKPPWKDTMAALFGNHVNWDNIRVFTGKQRPLARPKVMCPMSGLPAPYRDPRTNVPFANVRSYKILTDILGHRTVWSSALGCYVSMDSSDEQGSDERPGKRQKTDDDPVVSS